MLAALRRRWQGLLGRGCVCGMVLCMCGSVRYIVFYFVFSTPELEWFSGTFKCDCWKICQKTAECKFLFKTSQNTAGCMVQKQKTTQFWNRAYEGGFERWTLINKQMCDQTRRPTSYTSEPLLHAMSLWLIRCWNFFLNQRSAMITLLEGERKNIRKAQRIRENNIWEMSGVCSRVCVLGTGLQPLASSICPVLGHWVSAIQVFVTCRQIGLWLQLVFFVYVHQTRCEWHCSCGTFGYPPSTLVWSLPIPRSSQSVPSSSPSL